MKLRDILRKGYTRVATFLAFESDWLFSRFLFNLPLRPSRSSGGFSSDLTTVTLLTCTPACAPVTRFPRPNFRPLCSELLLSRIAAVSPVPRPSRPHQGSASPACPVDRRPAPRRGTTRWLCVWRIGDLLVRLPAGSSSRGPESRLRLGSTAPHSSKAVSRAGPASLSES